MLDTFTSLTKLFRYRRIHIDGYVFRLHCTLTVIILTAFVAINSAKQLVGAPIACSGVNEIEEIPVINSWCYTRGIFSNRFEGFHKRYVYVGIGQSPDRTDNYRPNVWYQWVWFMLLFQAITFYFPRWLWKGFEGGKMSTFVTNLDYFTVRSQPEKKKIEIIVEYLYRNNGYNDWYAIKYFFCEVLALLNVFIQMAINQEFLRQEFQSLGYEWMQFITSQPNSVSDPLERLFPIQSKCQLIRLGSSGHTETLDFFCVLSINIFNQKVYLFCWFWFIFLAVVLSFVIAFRLVLICCPLMRYYCCRFRFELSDESRRLSRTLVVNKLRLGDWFLLFLLGQNVEPILFCEIIEKLCEKLKIESHYPNDSNGYPDEEFSKM